jgi:5,6,7,8-tetrahydromethanopterin hydro-lyase
MSKVSSELSVAKEALKRAIAGSPTAAEVVAAKSTAKHPYAVNNEG